ncbi:chorismate mutase [Sphingomonas changnyeongensis]|uniref:chorismate mutase n=1 Tax=Sphingomonas changnyeongensis TaxID=2698679 RepID=A0A7Z2NXQ1_9SPHN|nr:chorismate mutase [Sphingomonas changnyeongensis]QHL91412.1 chorismate mutase [Sphingomonas changnyeongensis]
MIEDPVRPPADSDAALAPEQCRTMVEVRAGVDAVDRALIDLLAVRFGYMAAAARIKPERNMVRDEARKAQVIGNALSRAETFGLPQDAIGALWEQLVEASIAYELTLFDRRASDPMHSDRKPL